MVRDDNNSLWLPPCILSYETLATLYKTKMKQTATSEKVTFNFVFKINQWETTASCLKTEFSKFISPKRYSDVFNLNQEELT